MKTTQIGHTLVELMIGLAIGAAVLGQTLNFYSQKLNTQADHVTLTRLTEELRSITHIISADMRRAGYWNSEQGVQNNPHAWLDVQPNCIILSYDANHDGAPTADANEVFAYRAKDGKVQSRQKATDCDSGRWETINDPAFLTIDQFTIDSELHKGTCLNLSDEHFSSCNVYDCDYSPYKAGDVLIVQPSVHLTLSAYSIRNRYRQEVVQTVTLNNPVSITADHSGPVHTLAHGC